MLLLGLLTTSLTLNATYNTTRSSSGVSTKIKNAVDSQSAKNNTVNKIIIPKGLKRISKPGRRVYSSVEDMPRVLSGLGIAIVSTSKGVITDKVARAEKVGGEVLAFVW